MTCFPRGLCSDEMLISPRPTVERRQAVACRHHKTRYFLLRSCPARWMAPPALLHSVLLRWVALFTQSAAPEAPVLALTQPRDRLQVQPEGREQCESGSICLLAFWQSAGSGLDSGWLPAHTSCNSTCAVTRSTMILSREGAPLGSPTGLD